MLINDYGAARHLAARLEIGVDNSLCKQRIGQSVSQVFSTLLPPAHYYVPSPQLTSWEEVSVFFFTKDVEQKRLIRQQARQDDIKLTAWWLEQIHQTRQPLLERMTLFWHNHFTSNTEKVIWPQLMLRQNQVLRQHALGNFADMLHALSRDPAMLRYLDGVNNVVSSPNENFARELLELFTLGEGHYSETDIIEAARAFTGWSLDMSSASFTFHPGQHDNGSKRFLGREANLDGEDILNILLQEPRTAEYIAEKFWAEFINHGTPDPALIKVWGKAFRDSGYEITALLQAIIHSQVFWDQAQRGQLIKSPVDFVLGLLREMSLPVDDYTLLKNIMAQLGQDLFHPPDVKGWRGGSAWITNTRLIRRYDLIPKLMAEHAEGMTTTPAQRLAPATLRQASGKSALFQGLFAQLVKQFSCQSSTWAEWLLPIPPVAEPDCTQDEARILLTLLKDPVYQLR